MCVVSLSYSLVLSRRHWIPELRLTPVIFPSLTPLALSPLRSFWFAPTCCFAGICHVQFAGTCSPRHFIPEVKPVIIRANPSAYRYCQHSWLYSTATRMWTQKQQARAGFRRWFREIYEIGLQKIWRREIYVIGQNKTIKIKEKNRNESGD